MNKIVVFFDSQVEKYRALSEGIPAGAEIVVLDYRSDGIEQIGAYLLGRTEIESIHVVSHGSAGALCLGNAVVTAESLEGYGETLRTIGRSLTPGGDILLYGCSVAAGDAGRTFVEKLAAITGANVAASDDPTGALALGGDSTLEISVGDVSTRPLFTQALFDELRVLLASTTSTVTPDPNTPNATWIVANPLGVATAPGNITSTTQIDLYSFNADVAGTYVISAGGASIDSKLRVYNNLGATISGGVVDDWFGGTAETNTQTFAANTWYYVAVTSTTAVTGSYTLKITGPAPSQASTSTPGPTFKGSFTGSSSPAGDIDYFAITAPSGATKLFLSVDPAVGVNTFVELYNSAGTKLNTISNGVAGQSDFNSQPIVVTAGSTYFIGVSNNSPTATGAYTGTVDFDPDQVTVVANRDPVVASAVTNLSWTEGQSNTFTVPVGTFTDPDGDALTFQLSSSNTNALPSWLSFDASTRTLSGTPPSGSPDIAVRLFAIDPSNANAASDFTILTPAAVVANRAPVVAAPISGFSFTEGTASTNTVPSGTFTDPDGNALSFSASLSTLSSDKSLPSWLSFDATTRTFSGTAPSGSPDSTVRITATDTGGLSVFQDVLFSTTAAANRAPVVAAPISGFSFTEGTASTNTVPSGTFTDPDGNALTFSASLSTLSSDKSLPSWLSFDATTRTFSGTAPSNSPDSTVRITATDTGGLSVSQDVVFSTPAAANRAPVVASPISGFSFTEGTASTNTVPSGSFTDPDANALTLSASVSTAFGFISLPSWLSFDATTRTFSGTAPSDSPDSTIRITATDTGGLNVFQDVVFSTPGAASSSGLVLTGSGALLGASGNDTLTGLGGNDTFTGQAGNDAMDGGAGIDTAVYTGAKSAYAISGFGSRTTVADSTASRDGTDTLTNVERLKFSDVSVALDISGNAGTVAKILGAVFGPSSVSNKVFVGIGLGFSDGGMSYPDLMKLALNFALGTGFSNDAEIKLLFQNLLSAVPSQSDLTFWGSTITANQFTQASLAVMAADTSINTGNINLIGLAATGLEFVPAA